MNIFMDAAPNETVYVQNLNERVPVSRLKEALRDACAGEAVVDVVAKCSLALRGQAFVVCASRQAAGAVLARLNTLRLFGKTVVAAPARFRSNGPATADGTLAAEVRAREADKAARAGIVRPTRRQVLAQMASGVSYSAPPAAPPNRPFAHHDGGRDDRHGARRGAPPVPGANRVLFVTGVRPGTDEGALRSVFGRHAGLVDVRTVSARPDVAFVEYASEAQASVALAAANGAVLNGGPLRVAFARR